MKSLILFTSLLVLTSITINAQEVAKIQADSLSVYEDSAVEVKPSFPGGEEKLKLYIKKNYRLPRAEGQIGELGSMLVSFVVETDGRLTNFQGLGSSSAVQSSFQNLLQGSSRWQPGMNNNIAVRTQYTLPFSFVLSSTSKKSTARQPFGGKKKVKKRKVW